MTRNPSHRSPCAQRRTAETDWRDDALHAANASLLRDMSIDPDGQAHPWLARLIEAAAAVAVGTIIGAVVVARFAQMGWLS